MRLAGSPDVDMLAMLRANHRDIGRHLKTFRSFKIGGRAHGALPNDRFYAAPADSRVGRFPFLTELAATESAPRGRRTVPW